MPQVDIVLVDELEGGFPSLFDPVDLANAGFDSRYECIELCSDGGDFRQVEKRKSDGRVALRPHLIRSLVGVDDGRAELSAVHLGGGGELPEERVIGPAAFGFEIGRSHLEERGGGGFVRDFQHLHQAGVETEKVDGFSENFLHLEERFPEGRDVHRGA
ncbi:MAG: hypothetical protein BWY66_01416 [bacterium ADurb.Bin374]|nr:MAG: hypothetical protein BWY66_01416 [bacterium ADurb.Bin374]